MLVGSPGSFHTGNSIRGFEYFQKTASDGIIVSNVRKQTFGYEIFAAGRMDGSSFRRTDHVSANSTDKALAACLAFVAVILIANGVFQDIFG
jgi:hypothetical protein